MCNDPLLHLIPGGACSTSCRWGTWMRPGCIDQLLEAHVWGGVRTGDPANGGRSRTGGRSQFGRPRRAPVRKRHGDSPGLSRGVAPFSFPLDRCPSLYSMSPPVEVYLHSSPTAPKIQGICVTTASHLLKEAVSFVRPHHQVCERSVKGGSVARHDRIRRPSIGGGAKHRHLHRERQIECRVP